MNPECDANPILVRLTRRNRPPSLRAALQLTLGMGLASLIVCVWLGVLTSPVIEDFGGTLSIIPASIPPGVIGILYVLVGLAWLVTNISPLVMATFAGVLTAQDVGSEQYELVRLTHLSRGAIVSGYTLAILYRLWPLLTLSVGLGPMLVLGGAYTMLLSLVLFNPTCLDGCWWPLLFPEPDIGNVGWMLLLMFGAMAVGKWGENLLASVLGVALGLWWRKAAPAAIAALAIMLVLAVLRAALPTKSVLEMLKFSTDTSAALVRAAKWIAIYLLPSYLLSFGVMRLARRWA